MCHAPWARCRPHHHQDSHQHGHHAPWPFGGYAMHFPPHPGQGFDGGGGGGGSGPFGVRRPLRFLAYKLGLDEKQFTELARILDEIKTERAQAAVDDRRTLTDFADAMAADPFDAAKATTGATRRTESIARLNALLAKSLQQIHTLLNPDQRTRFAHMIRTGMLSL